MIGAKPCEFHERRSGQAVRRLAADRWSLAKIKSRVTGNNRRAIGVNSACAAPPNHCAHSPSPSHIPGPRASAAARIEWGRLRYRYELQQYPSEAVAIDRHLTPPCG